MRKFDPWPIFFRREWNRNWPFLVGFAITGTIITKGGRKEFSIRTEAQEQFTGMANSWNHLGHGYPCEAVSFDNADAGFVSPMQKRRPKCILSLLIMMPLMN
ncbi:hypothetical protein CUMW_088010 [Citrus unshiu]|nr:hypothetical protein CUMW_088010 [Citrus unshiu]